MVGELTYFLGLQVKQTDKGIYINQAKYAIIIIIIINLKKKNLLKRFGRENAS